MTDNTPSIGSFIERRNALYKQVDPLELMANEERKQERNHLLALGLVTLTKGQMLIMDMLIEILRHSNTPPGLPE